MMTTQHLQYDELRTAVAKFLTADPEGDIGLTVFAESLGHSVWFMFNHAVVGKGRESRVVHEPVIHMSRPHFLAADEYERRIRQAGLAAVPFQPRGEIVPVTSSEQGAKGALVVMVSVYGVPPSEWLFITDEREPDYRPSPLPRPAVWPPAAS
jgi:hypothetical protein